MKEEEEVEVHWINKQGVPMDIRTQRGTLIHVLWLAEHRRRGSKQALETTEQPAIIDIECQTKHLD